MTAIPDYASQKIPVCVGLDISVTGAAICVGTDAKHYRMERFGAEEPEGKGCRFRIDRLAKHADKLVKTVVDLVKKRKCLVVIEAYVASKFGGTSLTLAELGGIFRSKLLAALGDYIVDIVEAPTANMKKFVCGNGRGNKTPTIAQLTKEFDIPVHPEDDWYDAFGLCLMAWALAGKFKASEKRQAVLAELFTNKKAAKKQRARDAALAQVERERKATEKKAATEKLKADRAAAKKKAEEEKAARKAIREQNKTKADADKRIRRAQRVLAKNAQIDQIEAAKKEKAARMAEKQGGKTPPAADSPAESTPTPAPATGTILNF